MLRVAASVLYMSVLSLTCACQFPDRGQERELFLWVLADCDTAPHGRVMTPKHIVLAERQQYDYQVDETHQEGVVSTRPCLGSAL